MIISEWTIAPNGNEVLETNEEEYLLISYREDNFDTGYESLNKFFASDKKAETAMKFRGMWFILNGDFRKEYKIAFPNPEACLTVFKKNIAHISSWSNSNIEEVIEQLKKKRIKEVKLKNV